MGLMDAVRHAEQRGKKAVSRGATLARASFQNAEAGIRQQISAHIHHNHSNATLPVSNHADPEQESAPAAKARTGIVSVNGQDVEQMRCTGGRRTA